MRWPTAALLLAAVGTSGVVCAQDDALRVQVEQRVRLTARLIADSPSAQRILTSGNRVAIGHFDESRVHQSLAEDLLARGDLAGARRAVESALQHIGLARRMVPDARVRQADSSQRYETKLGLLTRLLEAWREHVAAGRSDSSELLAAVGLVDGARRIGQAGRHDEANAILENAESQVLAGMNRLLNARTLDYTARPANPVQEFQLELARQNALSELVPLALRELHPAPDAVALIERYQASSQTQLARAVQQFEGGDSAQALASLRDAILHLQRALAAAGVTTPQPIGSAP